MASSKGCGSKQVEKHGGGSNLSFERTVKKSTFSTVTVPAKFVREHGEKFQKYVSIQSDEESMLWTVTLNVQVLKGEPVVKLGSGWKDFVVSNCLRTGDHLTFTLVEKSKFFVTIGRRKEN